MKNIYIFIILSITTHTAGAQSAIYTGGKGDGFSFQKAGSDIYQGGASDGWAMAVLPTTPLPVTLLNLKGHWQDGQVVLQWQTAMESNNDHFDIERSTDGSRFSLVTQVTGHGNSQVTLEYQTIDPIPYPGTSYYRIRQVDFDGNGHYSGVIAVNSPRQGGAAILSLYPNPTVRTITLTVTGVAAGKAALILYDAAGKVVRRQEVVLAGGPGRIDLDISCLGAGIYYCQLENTGLPVIPFVKE